MTELAYLIALLNNTNLVFKFGASLFEMFPNIADLFTLSSHELVNIGLSEKEVGKLKNVDWKAVEQDLFWAQEPDNNIVTIKDSSYPSLLKEIPNPPLLLFVRGDLKLLELPQIAIVGSRNPTPVGMEIAFAFAKDSVQSGLVVTSGFARGIDAASHNGAIDGNGKTVAVMGTGINNIYPSQHKMLAQKILDSGGVLLSEFPLDAKGDAWHFPLRNRIISGLSLGTLVVEAALRSGSLITARLASEQGRDVFAIPGSICNPLARGCHYLISQGAKLVESVDDVLEEFNLSNEPAPALVIDSRKTKEKNKLDREHKKLLDCIGFETTAVDDLVARSNMDVQKISAVLLDLELQGFIKVVVGGYIRV